MMPSAATAPLLVNLSEIAEMEIFILKRMREITLGDHASVRTGAGFNPVELRDWEPGDSLTSIDWAQSSLTNFSPLVTRQFEQDSPAGIVAIVDASLSTRCGTAAIPIRKAIARSLAAVGLSAVLCQDRLGMVAFGTGFRQILAAQPRVGKPHVIRCLELYGSAIEEEDAPPRTPVVEAVTAYLRNASMIPVISDFLFGDAESVIHNLAALNGAHDVFLIMVDAGFAYSLPHVSASWIETVDVETGAVQVLSSREFSHLVVRLVEWQDQVRRLARESGLDLLNVGIDPWEMDHTLVNFMAERRLRKVKM